MISKRVHMSTHQSIAGFTDAELLQHMINSYPERYGDVFWAFFETHLGARLPANAVIVDLGCGPGLFLRALAERYVDAMLYGYDITPAMIAYAQQLKHRGKVPVFAVHDVASTPVPLQTGSVHLVCMTAVLHVLDEPLPALAEIRRLLAPGGLFVLHDWIRTPLSVYLSSRVEGNGETLEASRRRWFKMFPIHNKYTEADWRWLLTEAGFVVERCTQLRPHFRLFVAESVNA
jgi:SAM-dependent methyltransferase